MKRFKKIVATLLVGATLALSVAACGKVECDLCGEKKSCKTQEVLGEKINICKDCQEGINALANMFK